MNVADRAARPQKRCMELFFYIWILLYFLGSLAGLLAGHAALLANETALATFCSQLFTRGISVYKPLFFASAGFLLLSILASQLPWGRQLVWLLVAGKAFSTAYVFGIFYLLREQEALTPALAGIVLHTFFLLPPFYFLCLHCRRGSLSGRGRYWFQYRIFPVFLCFIYLALAILLERSLMVRIFH